MWQIRSPKCGQELNLCIMFLEWQGINPGLILTDETLEPSKGAANASDLS